MVDNNNKQKENTSEVFTERGLKELKGWEIWFGRIIAKFVSTKQIVDLSIDRVGNREFPGCPVVKTWCFHCWGSRFHP